MIGTILYNIFIMPIQIIIEMVFHALYVWLSDCGYAIIGVSIVVNILLFPLYRRADMLQAEERERQRKMERWVTHIRNHFRGDERYMMLSAYYRENHYHPLYALRSSISLLLQIPFFTAAYRFLSHLSLLSGQSFWFIKDLGAPDQSLVIGGIAINVLPVLMTVINLVSGAIYAKGYPLKEKLPSYVLALLFLILLYDSPAGLVFYWTCNNIFSLVKNAGFSFAKKKEGRKEESFLERTQRRSVLPFMLGCILMTLILGYLIPSAIINAAPADFINVLEYQNLHVKYLIGPFFLAVGFCIFWFGIIYCMLRDSGKDFFEKTLFIVSGCSLINYMIFKMSYSDFGSLSTEFYYDFPVQYTVAKSFLNILFLTVASVVLHLLWKHKKWVHRIYYVLILTILGMCIVNSARIQIRSTRIIESTAEEAVKANPDTLVTLSSSRENVVLIMLDRSISSFLPYIFEEKPELKEQFAGFTYYPNTLSFGGHTVYGAPPLFGGYEYVPEKMNERDRETLVDKTNEALKVLPVLFSEKGWDITVCDPPEAGYEAIPDLTIYKDYPEINTYITQGKYEDDFTQNVKKYKNGAWMTYRLFMYSLMRVLPCIIRPLVYDDGFYNTSDRKSYSVGMEQYSERYAVLEKMIEFTKVNSKEKGTFFLISNRTTHEPVELQLPDYVPSQDTDNTGYNTEYRDCPGRDRLDLSDPVIRNHYMINTAAMLKIGQWLDYLRQQDAYDNTRIIIVADHGMTLGLHPEVSNPDITELNPLFLVKDFGENEDFETSWDFMTNADTAFLCTKDVIDEPENLFTGKQIDNMEKTAGSQKVTTAYRDLDPCEVGKERTTFDIREGEWWYVHDDIFDQNNWKSE